MKSHAPFSESRRRLLRTSGLAVASGALLGISPNARAADPGSAAGAVPGVAAVVIGTEREGICATCQYWGGLRRVAVDGKSVLAESLGWCNNRASPSFQMMRSPEAGPMKAWRKWDAL
jgi:hypothetical protein